MAAFALLAVVALPDAAPGQVKLSRSAICHCPGGAYYERTIHFTAYPSIDSCLAVGGRHPEVGQGDCDALAGPGLGIAGSLVPRGPLYDRALFGGWTDEDGDCRDTRAELLAELSTVPVRWSADGCRVERGRWIDPYTGRTHLDAETLDVDHVVPLAYAWARGADGWDSAAREHFGLDPANLLPVEDRLNRSKGSRGPLSWLPPDEGFQCQYVLRFRRLSLLHGLEVSEEEGGRLEALSQDLCRGGGADARASG